MNSRSRLWSRALSGNLLISLLLLLLFAVISTYLLSYIHTEKKRNSGKILATITSDFDLETARLKGIMTLCKKDPSFILAMSNHLSFEEFYAHAMDASDTLTTIKNTLPYALNAFIVVKNNSYIVLPNRFMQPQEFLIDSVNKQLNAEEILPDLMQLRDGFYSFDRFALFVTNVENYGSIVFQIDLRNFCILDDFTNAFDGWDIVVLNQAGEYFASSRPDINTLKNISWTDYFTAEEAIIVDERCSVWHSTAPTSRFSFVIFKPIALVEKVLTSINLIVYCAILVCGILCLWLTLFNGRRYRRIMMIANKYGGKLKDDAFQFIDSKLDELIKSNSDLSKMAAINDELKLDTVLNLLVNGGNHTNQFSDDILCQIHAYYVLCLAAQDENGDHPQPDDILSLDNDLLQTFGIKRLPCRSDSCLYLAGADVDSDAVANRIRLHFEEKPFLVFGGASPIYQDIRLINEAVDVSFEALKSTSIDLAMPVFGITRTIVPAIGHIGLDQLNKVAGCVLNADKEQIGEMLHVLLLSREGLTLADLMMDYGILSAMYETLMKSVGGVARSRERAGSMPCQAIHPHYIYHRLYEDFIEINELVQSQNRQSKYPIVEYINAHFRDPLSLESLAATFGITPAYLSAWFKRTTGMNFASYLSAVRMRSVQEIIASDPNIKNDALAQKAGFVSTSTFMRQFRNYYGVSPEKFKQGYPRIENTANPPNPSGLEAFPSNKSV